jgi:transposase
VDLLPDRDADTLAMWLRERPGVAIVARDRAGAYADGVRRGAPEAIQVADRWHLWRNASDALLWVLERHRGTLSRVGRAIMDEAAVAVRPQRVAPPQPTKLHERRRRRPAERDVCFERVATLSRSGMSADAIRRETGGAPNTVRNWLRAGGAPTWRKGLRKACLIDPFLPYLVRRLKECEGNATQLWREIRELGYTGPAVGAGPHRREGERAVAVGALQSSRLAAANGTSDGPPVPV